MIAEAYEAGWNEALEKTGAKLSSKARSALPSSDFVFPKSRKFPIEDKAHARNALAREHFAENPSAVERAVHAKYPGIK